EIHRHSVFVLVHTKSPPVSTGRANVRRRVRFPPKRKFKMSQLPGTSRIAVGSAAMDRYYFHIRTKNGLDLDEIGVDCKSLDDAKQQAVGFARVVWELLAHDKLAGC